jgi:hypothetical protein
MSTSESVLESIGQILEFLQATFAPKFTSYGIDYESVHSANGEVTTTPALKPNFFFRGQNHAYPRLIPSLYHGFPELSAKALSPETVLRRKDGGQRVIAANPHYNQDFDRAYVFSRLKCLEVGELLQSNFSDFPREIDAAALCQHYGLVTPYMDFTENLLVAAFFATHTFSSGRWEPCSTGTGVLYLLDLAAARADGHLFHEIGSQPLPRPYAQRGSLFFVPHELNMLSLEYLQCFGFGHNENIARDIAAKVGGAESLFPPDKFANLVESHRNDNYVTRRAIDLFLDEPPRPHRDEREYRLLSLLTGIEVRSQAGFSARVP